MKKITAIISSIVMILVFSSCFEDLETDSDSGFFNEIKLKVNFENEIKNSYNKHVTPMTNEIPEDYMVAIKSVKLIGDYDTEDYLLFNYLTLDLSEEYTFAPNSNILDIVLEEDIPVGTYTSIQIEIYYFQMNLSISTTDRGIERRNLRIYLSGDIIHKPGDITQITDNLETGWMFGEGQEPNMDPVSPRITAYTYNGDGETWYYFSGRSTENFGPFGSYTFWMYAPQPVYYATADFSFESTSGTTI